MDHRAHALHGQQRSHRGLNLLEPGNIERVVPEKKSDTW